MRYGRLARQLVSDLRRRRAFHRGVRVLAYHGVVDAYRDPRVEESFHLAADFREHVRLLRRCRVVAIADLPAALLERSRLPAVAITFDDGFANNLVAAEILSAAKLPATFFVATGNVSAGTPIWPTILRLVLARGSARALRLAGELFDLDRDSDAAVRVRALFKRATTDQRLELWTQIESALAVGELDELVASFPSIAMMSWSDVRSLGDNISIGSHGVTHELLHAEQPIARRRFELVESKRTVESELGRSCLTFAFPNGTHHDASSAEVADAGYELAFTMAPRAASPDTNPRAIPRLVPGAAPEKLAAALLFGS